MHDLDNLFKQPINFNASDISEEHRDFCDYHECHEPEDEVFEKWSLMYPQILELPKRHQQTLVQALENQAGYIGHNQKEFNEVLLKLIGQDFLCLFEAIIKFWKNAEEKHLWEVMKLPSTLLFRKVPDSKDFLKFVVIASTSRIALLDVDSKFDSREDFIDFLYKNLLIYVNSLKDDERLVFYVPFCFTIMHDLTDPKAAHDSSSYVPRKFLFMTRAAKV